VRVLTDLYVQKPTHTSEEERQYTELVLRLIDSVDSAMCDRSPVGAKDAVSSATRARWRLEPQIVSRDRTRVAESTESISRSTSRCIGAFFRRVRGFLHVEIGQHAHQRRADVDAVTARETIQSLKLGKIADTTDLRMAQTRYVFSRRAYARPR